MGKLKALKEKFFAPNPSFTVKEQLGYCGGIFGNCMGQDCIGTFADKFFREFMKIKANHITLYSNIAMGFAFVIAAISGYVLDTPTPPGKKTPTKIITGVTPLPFAVSSMLLFVVPTQDPFRNFIWMTIFHLVFNTADQFYDASLNTLSLRMTNNANDRKNFYTVGTLAAALGSMLPGWLIPMLVGSTTDAAKQQNFYFYSALVFCVLGVSLMYAPFFTLNEKIRVTARPEKEKLAWDRETIVSVLHNRTFIITEIATFFEQVRQMSYTLLPYMYENVLGDLRLKAIMDVVSGTLSYVGLLAVPFLGSHFSARTVLSGGFAYTGIFYAIMGLLGMGFSSEKMSKRKFLIGLMIGLAGMPNNAISASKKVVVGDSTDYMEWYAEKRFGRPIHAEGFITATQSMLGNVFNIIRTNIYNIIFSKIGYLPNTTDANGKQIKPVQSEKTLHGIFLMFILFGVVGNFLASIAYQFDTYTGEKKAKIYAELLEMREKRLAEAEGAEPAEGTAAEEAQDAE
ncbi:MAG: MFS transporter [Clostridia bacterium]|nr:MFS transporter [Clostridia bacterium]